MLTPTPSWENAGLPHSSPAANTVIPPAAATGKESCISRDRRAPKVLCLVSSRSRAAAMDPRRVWRPTATTTAHPVPTVTSLPSRTMRASGGPCSTCLQTGTDSPVSGASSTSRPWVVSRRASAGTRSPGSTSRMSPGTTSDAGTTAGAPSRKTRAVAVPNCRIASVARPAWCSCQAPRTVLRATVAAMMMTSRPSPPIANDRIAPPPRMAFTGEPSWSRIEVKTSWRRVD